MLCLFVCTCRVRVRSDRAVSTGRSSRTRSFHVGRWFTEGLTLVRREIQRRPPDQRPPTYEPDLLRARFTLLGRADHLSDAH